MSTSIGSAAAFSYANMKPASGEQIDALWGQNVADNTAFLRAVSLQVYLSPRGEAPEDAWIRGTTAGAASLKLDLTPLGYFCRPSAHNRLVGTIRFDGTWTDQAAGHPDCGGTIGVYLYGDIATYGGTTTFATANINGNFTRGSTFSFELDLANYLSVGSWGTIAGYFSGSSADYSITTPSIYGTFGFLKARTTWAN
jgi:hypothetical protein